MWNLCILIFPNHEGKEEVKEKLNAQSDKPAATKVNN